MYTVELSSEDLDLIRAALSSYLDEMGREEGDIIERVQEILEKLGSY